MVETSFLSSYFIKALKNFLFFSTKIVFSCLWVRKDSSCTKLNRVPSLVHKASEVGLLYIEKKPLAQTIVNVVDGAQIQHLYSPCTYPFSFPRVTFDYLFNT